MLPARTAFWLVALVLGPMFPSLLRVLFISDVEPSRIAVVFISLLMDTVLLVMLWRETGGYIVLGVRGEQFRQILHSTFEKLNLPFDESLSRLRLTTLDADLQVTIHATMGTAYLRMKQPQQASVFRKIVDSLRKDFASTSTQFDVTMCIFDILFGIFGLTLAIYIF